MKLPELSTGQSRFLDFFTKSIGGVFAIIVLFRGIYEFKVSKEREFKIQVYKEQIDIMKEFVDCTSTIATMPRDSVAYIKADLQFNRLRIGKLFLFSDDSLDIYVGEYFSMINKYERGSPDVTQTDLAAQSSKMSNYCKQQIITLTKID